jgi:hypothetical protein
MPFFYGVDHETALLLAVADAGLTAGASDLPELVEGLRKATQSKPWQWLQVRVHLILIDLNMGRLREAASNATVLRKELHAGMSRRPVPAWAAASVAEHGAAAEASRELLPTVMQAELYLWTELRNFDDVGQLATGIGRTVASDTTGAYAALPLLPLRAAQTLETMAHGRPPNSQLQANIAALWRAAAGGVLGTGDVMKLALVSSTGRPYQRAVRANGGPTTETVRKDYSAKDARSAWHAHAGDGGWMQHQPEAKRTKTDTSCDIDRRSQLSTAELLRDYVNRGRPVLVRGLLDGWPVNRWKRSSMLRRRGNHSVLVRSSAFIAAARSTGGFRSADAAAGGTSMLLREFMMRDVDNEEDDETNTEYVFTSDSDLVEAGKDYFHLALFADHSSSSSVLPWTASERESKAIFFYGKNGSGVGFHHHSNALNALLFGRKRWFLSPLHTFHGPWGGPIMGYLELLQHGHLPSQPIQCVQEAGEVLFVPTGWEHATLNDEESIGIAMELGDEPEQSLAVLLSGGNRKVKNRKRKRRSGL